VVQGVLLGIYRYLLKLINGTYGFGQYFGKPFFKMKTDVKNNIKIFLII
jgi:hypothetical protein